MENMCPKFLKILICLVFSHFLGASITIDGKLSEPEWENAQLVRDFLTVYPNDKSSPKYKKEVRFF